MTHVWKIFKQDLLNIKRVPLVGILLIGLAILPSLYAWFNLSASWDPYANTEGVQVAVVNEDKGAYVDGEFINVGEELTENLQNNDNFGWSFVEREEAEKGVEYGDYYASIYISSSFSEDLSSVVKGEPDSAQVHYQVNEKVNAIAPKMTSAGASAIVKEINEQFIEETSKSLFQEFDRLGLKLEEELPTFRRIKQTVYDLESHFPAVNEFADQVVAFDENWGEIDNHINQFLELRSLSPQIDEGTEQILLLESRLPEINELGEGVLQLEETIPDIEKAVAEVDELNNRFADIADLLEEALDGAREAQVTIENAQEMLPEVEERADSIEDYSEALMVFIDEVEGSSEKVSETVAQQALFASQTAASAENTLNMFIDNEEEDNAKDVLKELDEQLANHIDVLDNAIDMYSSIHDYSGDEELLEVINQLTKVKEQLQTFQKELQGALTTIESGQTPGKDLIESLQSTASETEQMAGGLHDYLMGEGADQTDQAIQNLRSGLVNAGNSFEENYKALQTVEETLENAEKIAVSGEESIEEQIERLPELEESIKNITQQIQDTLPLITEAIESAAAFVREDLPGIEAKIYETADFIRDDLPKVKEDYRRLAELLEENMPQVEEAVNELAEFSRSELPEMEENLGEVADQIRDIEEEDRLNEIISVLRNDLDEETDFFANPVNLVEEELFPIPNYGSANAPFYTTLSLWVGALLLSNLISTNLHTVDRRPEFTLRSIYLGRMILFLIMGVLQGLIVSIGNLTLLGVYADSPYLFVLFSVIIAVVFMTMVYTLASILGNIGKALAIVLLVLQLSGGGGTFPIEVAPPFFQQINPYLPFTYAINLLREAAGGIIPALVWKNVIILSGFWVLTLAVGLLLKPVLASRIERTYAKSKSSRLVE
ncbi:YhgE/Pip domain-containing protein [Salipaludibacillus sp. CUR1]|uniref:YhgE/Pip domain-containing protein n=1 Tax=Salipaludibacillus sp. CUR1 TaxID=2820003 RepID=UPI001E56592F|nr:YhgE/Pip domain-containing protein [Salipaludibacillus sp. CUR1]MCE7794444.1 YhgE/Pip domain-containing protein [Salipaludibacillus sp. CUR1]